jgi:hypothetical protein
VRELARALLLGAALAAAPAPAEPGAPPPSGPAAVSSFDHQHLAWQRLLERAQRDGLVDYEALRDRPEELDAYLLAIARVDKGDYTAWTPEQRLAFWLNAVNAFTLKAVADAYPFKRPWWKPAAYKYPANSVRQQPDFDGRLFSAAGEELTLAEARRLAVQLAPDPRLPLALTCPCLGGPPLPAQAFTPDRLDAQLDAAARAFVRDPRRVSIVDERAQVIRLSQALRRPEIGEPLSLARRYLPPDQAQLLSDRGWTIEWQPLDWTLDELGTREAGKGAPKAF